MQEIKFLQECTQKTPKNVCTSACILAYKNLCLWRCTCSVYLWGHACLWVLLDDLSGPETNGRSCSPTQDLKNIFCPFSHLWFFGSIRTYTYSPQAQSWWTYSMDCCTLITKECSKGIFLNDDSAVALLLTLSIEHSPKIVPMYISCHEVCSLCLDVRVCALFLDVRVFALCFKVCALCHTAAYSKGQILRPCWSTVFMSMHYLKTLRTGWRLRTFHSTVSMSMYHVTYSTETRSRIKIVFLILLLSDWKPVHALFRNIETRPKIENSHL